MSTVSQAQPETEWRLADTASLRFEVSSDGRVRNRRTQREIALTVTQTGYPAFATRFGGRKGAARLYKVHHLVALAFVGPKPTARHVINHKDGNKLNNNAENLEWVTYSENTLHALRTGLLKVRRGVDQGAAKLTDRDVRAIRREYIPEHPSRGCRALADRYGISHSTISRVVNGKAWSHVGVEP